MKKSFKNHILSSILLVMFFGAYPREYQEVAPTVFAIFSIIIYSVCKKTLDRIDLNKLVSAFEEKMKNDLPEKLK